MIVLRPTALKFDWRIYGASPLVLNGHSLRKACLGIDTRFAKGLEVLFLHNANSSVGLHSTGLFSLFGGRIMVMTWLESLQWLYDCSLAELVQSVHISQT